MVATARQQAASPRASFHALFEVRPSWDTFWHVPLSRSGIAGYGVGTPDACRNTGPRKLSAGVRAGAVSDARVAASA